MNIIYEDAAFLAVVKPQGMAAQPDKTGDTDLLTLLEQEKGQPLGLLHRLDRPVGGLMLFAKEKQAEAFLAKQIQEKTLQKTYLTVLCGRLPQAEGTLTDYLLKNARTNLSAVVPSGRKGAKQAILRYRRLAELETAEGWLTLAEIALETGRHHQIRVQLSHLGTPIWGDRKYHPAFLRQFPTKRQAQIALWSYRLEGIHPLSKELFSFTALPEGEPFSLFAETLQEL